VLARGILPISKDVSIKWYIVNVRFTPTKHEPEQYTFKNKNLFKTCCLESMFFCFVVCVILPFRTIYRLTTSLSYLFRSAYGLCAINRSLRPLFIVAYYPTPPSSILFQIADIVLSGLCKVISNYTVFYALLDAQR